MRILHREAQNQIHQTVETAATSLSVRQAADVTGLRVPTVLRAIHGLLPGGALPARRIDGRLVVLADDLHQWVVSQPAGVAQA